MSAAVITTFGLNGVLLSHSNFHSDDIFNKKSDIDKLICAQCDFQSVKWLFPLEFYLACIGRRDPGFLESRSLTPKIGSESGVAGFSCRRLKEILKQELGSMKGNSSRTNMPYMPNMPALSSRPACFDQVPVMASAWPTAFHCLQPDESFKWGQDFRTRWHKILCSRLEVGVL